MRLVLTLLAAAAIPALAWISGYDFPGRSPALGAIVFGSGFSAFGVWFYPGWDE